MSEKTLWDEYAMAALTGILANYDNHNPKQVTTMAAEVADQMMKVKEDRRFKKERESRQLSEDLRS